MSNQKFYDFARKKSKDKKTRYIPDSTEYSNKEKLNSHKNKKKQNQSKTKNINDLILNVDQNIASNDFNRIKENKNLPKTDTIEKEKLTAHFKNMAKEYYTPEVKEEKHSVGDQTKYFHELNLIDPIFHALSAKGYVHPTPVQFEVIPKALSRKDIIASAQTGSGKTAAFALPTIQLLLSSKKKRVPRALILTPTRELAVQISQNIKQYASNTKLRQVTVYGGVSKMPQINQLERGRDIIVATPGRLQDLYAMGKIDLDNIEMLVLDEADRMLSMGFIDEIKEIIATLPKTRQIMLFSATMPPQINKLAEQFMNNPIRVVVDDQSTPVDTIESSVLFVEEPHKLDLLLHILKNESVDKALIFMNTKESTYNVVRRLRKERISVDSIHGDKSQFERSLTLKDFKSNRFNVLVATDVASRGIDVDDISHVINYDMTFEPEVYIHRIGRTARAGKSGIAINFCASSERRLLEDIERMIKQHLLRPEEYPFMSHITPPAETDFNAKRMYRGDSKRRFKKGNSKKRFTNKPSKRY
ncbi:MAG: DEAD/DEAH box helicase [Candidatus Heimdallarchaeota archaeon]|nr:DEAD/DEAH box helicase [Candidatus Heimdallarchaeota archaeon]